MFSTSGAKDSWATAPPRSNIGIRHSRAPKFPTASRNRDLPSSGFVELEFTVMPDGSTGNVTVTNSNPRKTFDAAAIAAVSEWRYKPVMREGKAVEQRVAVRIRFSDQ